MIILGYNVIDANNSGNNTNGENNEGGGGGSSPLTWDYSNSKDAASLAISNVHAQNDFAIVGQKAFDGIIKTDMHSVIQEVFEKKPVQSLFSSLQGEGVFKGLAVVDKVGKVLGIASAAESLIKVGVDLYDDGDVNVADAAVSVGSLFLKSNIVGFAVSGGWMLIKGEFEDN